MLGMFYVKKTSIPSVAGLDLREDCKSSKEYDDHARIK